MAATFPNAKKSFTRIPFNTKLTSPIHNEVQEEIEAIEAELLKTSGSVIDHGALSGLGDDDHPQYLNNTRGDARYLGKTSKAADSDKLDNIDSSGFVQTSGDQTVNGQKSFSSFPITPSSAPTADYEVANKKYVDELSGRMFLIAPQVIFIGTGEKPAGVTKITASAYGIPSNAKAVLVRVSPMWATILGNSYLALRAQATAPTGKENQIVVRPQYEGRYNDMQGWCSLNANGEFWYEISGGNAGNGSYLGIIGYLA